MEMQCVLSQLAHLFTLLKPPDLEVVNHSSRTGIHLNVRHRAEKHLSWPIAFLKTLGLQKNTTSAGVKFLFKSVFLERYQKAKRSAFMCACMRVQRLAGRVCLRAGVPACGCDASAGTKAGF